MAFSPHLDVLLVPNVKGVVDGMVSRLLSPTSTLTDGHLSHTTGVGTPGLGRHTTATTTKRFRRVMGCNQVVILALGNGMIPTIGSNNGGKLLVRGYRREGLLDIGMVILGTTLHGWHLRLRVHLHVGVTITDKHGLRPRLTPMKVHGKNNHSPLGMIHDIVMHLVKDAANEVNLVTVKNDNNPLRMIHDIVMYLARDAVNEVHLVTEDGFALKRRGQLDSIALGCSCPDEGMTTRKGSIVEELVIYVWVVKTPELGLGEKERSGQLLFGRGCQQALVRLAVEITSRMCSIDTSCRATMTTSMGWIGKGMVPLHFLAGPFLGYGLRLLPPHRRLR